MPSSGRAADPTPAPTPAIVNVAKATNACFSDMVRVTGFVVPRRAAVVVADTEGSKVASLLVREGDMVNDAQELARITPPPSRDNPKPSDVSLRAPAAGLLIEVRTAAGAPASPQAGPMFRIAVGNELDLEAEVPGMHMLKLNPGATVRITRDGESDVTGRLRIVSPEIDRATQLGRVRIAIATNPTLKVGMFARASIDARRSCGVSIPRQAVDHQTVQVVRGATIETRRIRTGLTSANAIEVLEGVAEGDVVVADAGTSLHDGDQVKPIFPDEFDRTRTR